MKVPDYFRRAVRLDLMDFDSSLSQMVHLITSPSQVFRMAKARKMTKNVYARDDPAFSVLQVFFLITAVVAWGMVMQCHVGHVVKNILFHTFVIFIAFGVVTTLLLWIVSNHFMMAKGQLNEVRRDVELLYCWDIHTNAFFSCFMLLYVAQLYALPLMLKSATILSCLVPNLLWAVAITAYLYITFLGLIELPFLTRQQVVLYPIALVWGLSTVLTLSSVNLTVWVVSHLIC
eukprot:PhF_6_TR16588/c0_g1_i1/m.25277